MTKDEFAGLGPGDIVRHKKGSEGVIITYANGKSFDGVIPKNISNPIEWDLISKNSLNGVLNKSDEQIISENAFKRANLLVKNLRSVRPEDPGLEMLDTLFLTFVPNGYRHNVESYYAIVFHTKSYINQFERELGAGLWFDYPHRYPFGEKGETPEDAINKAIVKIAQFFELTSDEIKQCLEENK